MNINLNHLTAMSLVLAKSWLVILHFKLRNLLSLHMAAMLMVVS